MRLLETGGGGDRMGERGHGLDRLAGIEEEGERPERGQLHLAPPAAGIEESREALAALGVRTELDLERAHARGERAAGAPE